MDFDSLEKHQCIKCSKGGQILLCAEKGCPVSIHEKCLTPKAKFDESGNFFCPYCSYKKAMTKVQEMRNKADSAKQVMSKFCNVSLSVEEKQGNEYPGAGDAILPAVENQNQIEGEIATGRHQLMIQGKDEATGKLADAEEKSNKVSETIEETKNDSGEETDESDDLKGKIKDDSDNEGPSIGPEQKHKKRKTLQTLGHERNFPAVNSKVKTKMQSHQLSHSKVRNIPLSGRRKGTMWSSEEVEMLKDGVKHFSSNINKKLPWREILEFGSSVFKKGRTPEDLKNKWNFIGRKG